MDATRRRTDNPSRLRRLREDAGYSLRRAARAAGISRRELAAYEDGRAAAPPSVRRDLAELYDVPAGALVPQRNLSRVVIEGPSVRIGKASRLLNAYNPRTDEVLDGYVALVNKLRGLQPGDPFPLRDVDVAHLADALGRDPESIERRLMELIHCSREEAERIRGLLTRRRMLLPAAGMAMGAALVGVPRFDPDTAIEPPEPVTIQYKGLTLGAPQVAAPGPVDPLGLPLTAGADPAGAEVGGPEAAGPAVDLGRPLTFDAVPPGDDGSAEAASEPAPAEPEGSTTGGDQDATAPSSAPAPTEPAPTEPAPSSSDDGGSTSGDGASEPTAEEPPADEDPDEQRRFILF